jgi:hypothetical protein
MRTPLSLLVAMAALHGPACAGTPIQLQLAPGKADEACMTLRAGDTLTWRFEADAAVAFNVHHHVGQEVLMPVDVKDARTHAGSLVADRANDWCLMWTAPKDRAARIQGEWSSRAKP